MKRELLLGAGKNLTKKITIAGSSEWSNLTTLDFNRDHCPDIHWNLEDIPYGFSADDEWDEIHAYEVLEHTGKQGDWRFFFQQWSEFWRMLKPGGFFAGTCPARDSVWAWGDPSHSRVIQPESLVFLCQPKYAQVGITPMSDFRHVYKADFEIVHANIENDTFIFVLQAIKPSRVSLPSAGQ